jgi:hypothetical protein
VTRALRDDEAGLISMGVAAEKDIAPANCCDCL